MSALFNFKYWYSRMQALESILEGIIHRDENGRPTPVKLAFPNGETNPPVCLLTGKQFTGKGLICFDFDQTLTTAWFGHPKNPNDRGSHSTKNPNAKMLNKMKEHKTAGNKVVIVTARGEKEGQLTGDAGHYAGLQPVLTADKTLGHSGLKGQPDRSRDWHPAIKNDPMWSAIPQSVESPAHAFHLGAVSLSTMGEEKGPFIATKMANFNMHSRKAGENPHPETGEPQGNYLWAILYDDGPNNVKSVNAQQLRGIPMVGIPVDQVYDRGGEKPAGVVATRSASGM